MTDFAQVHTGGEDGEDTGGSGYSPPPAKPRHAYRPDIDGLRALAVVPVVLNHLEMRGFGGGYIGVDIFFVISGYLITGILVRDLAEDRHSIAEFYRRRILRIFPALFVMLAVTTAVACFTMLPSELVAYARSFAATALFASNMLFYSESGYFEAASHIKPLLHTWSLAIEEQFYILWPLMLAWVGTTRRAKLKATVLGVTAVSFVIAIATMAYDASAAFYLLPSRAWELGIGGCLALVANAPRKKWINEFLGSAGIIVILLCIWKYNQQTPFPGLAALPPCLGAAFLILTGTKDTLASRMLSLPPVVFIGRISFSLYLWHWPVIVFTDIWLFLQPTPPVVVSQIIASVILATLSWRYVETPLRSGKGRTSRQVIAAGLAVIAAAVLLAGAIIAMKGFTNRFTERQAAIARFADMDQEDSYRRGTCFISNYRDTYDAGHCLKVSTGKPVLLLVGDSQAAHLWPGLAQLRDKYDVVQATMVGCTPMLYPNPKGQCERFFRSIMGDWIKAHRPAGVLMSGRWRHLDVDLLRATLADPDVRASNPILVGPVPEYFAALPRLLVYADRRNDPGLPMRFFDKSIFATNVLMHKVAQEEDVPFLSLTDKLCPNGTCRAWATPGIPLQFDYGHLSAEGSKVVADLLASDLSTAMQHRPKTP